MLFSGKLLDSEEDLHFGKDEFALDNVLDLNKLQMETLLTLSLVCDGLKSELVEVLQ